MRIDESYENVIHCFIMKIGTKYITIHRNINKIENDFQLLTVLLGIPVMY